MSLSPKVAISDDFLKSFAAIPKTYQNSVLKFVANFRQNPMANGTNYERILNAADENMRSVRITDDYRGIVLKPENGNVYCLLWVDKHDDAYRWACRHRVSIHPDLGSIQVYAVANNVEAAHPSVDLVDDALFSKLKDREIRKLGVPEENILQVRAVHNEEQLDALQDVLPDEAYEALYLYAAGDSYEKIINDRTAVDDVDDSDYSAALDREGSRRHFFVLTEDSDLEAIMAAPLDRWRIFLHPSQRKLIDRDWSGPVKVTGGAGTGKTVVAMHRAAYLARLYAELPGKPVLFTTFTKTLAEDIRHNLKLLCSSQELEKIQVINIDQWAISILRRFGYPHELLYRESERKRIWLAAMSAMPENVDLSLTFMRAEYERVVLPQGCESAEQYMRASRVGRGGQLGRALRKSIWPVFAEYRALLQAENLREPEEAFREAGQLIAREKPSLGIRAVVIDEAQDISAAAFSLIRSAVPHAANDLFLVGDAHQRIYRHKVVLSRLGIEVRGRSRSLKINYRTTDEIRKWACAQLEGCEIDDLNGNVDTLKGYLSLTHGEPPDVISIKNSNACVSEIKRLIQNLNQDGFSLSEVCITTRTNDELDLIEMALKSEGYPLLRLDASVNDDRAFKGIRLATMHRIKGLEFGVVIIALYLGVHEYARLFSRDEDAGVVDATELVERCLLHVAATRAKRHLLVINHSL